jgi:hypothetical protein
VPVQREQYQSRGHYRRASERSSRRERDARSLRVRLLACKKGKTARCTGLIGPVSVGSRSLARIARLHKLRNDPRFAATSAVWLTASRLCHLASIIPAQTDAHSNESPPLSVSVSGKRDFAGQRRRRRKGPSHSIDRQQRQTARTKTRQLGAICTTPGNLCLHETAWWGWEDSNFQPNDYQLPALSNRSVSISRAFVSAMIQAL